MSDPIHTSHNRLFTDMFREVERSVKDPKNSSASIRFKDGKAYVHTAKVHSWKIKQSVAKKRHFVKALHLAIKNQFGKKVADAAMKNYMDNTSNEIKNFASINWGALQKINDRLKNNKVTKGNYSINTSAKLNKGIQKITYTDAQIADIQKDMNEIARGNINNAKNFVKTGTNKGLHKTFVKDFGRSTYKLDKTTLSGKSIKTSSDAQSANCGTTLHEKIKDAAKVADMKKLGAILHQGIFGSRYDAARNNPLNKHPAPFNVGDSNLKLRPGSSYTITSTENAGVYKFTAISDTNISNIAEASDPMKEAKSDWTWGKKSYAVTKFTGTIDLNKATAKNEDLIKLDKAEFEYKADFRPRIKDNKGLPV